MKVYKVKKRVTRDEIRKVWATDAKAAEALASLGEAGWLIHRAEFVETIASDPNISWADVDAYEIEGIDPLDRPDYSDAFLARATHRTEDRELTETELETLQRMPEFAKKLTEI